MTFNHHAIVESQIYMVFQPNRDSSNEIPWFFPLLIFYTVLGMISFIWKTNQRKPTTIHTLRRWDSSRAQQVTSQTWIDPPSLKKPQRIQRSKARKTQQLAWQKMMKVPEDMACIMTSRGYKKGVAPEKSSWNYHEPQWKNTEFVVSSKGPPRLPEPPFSCVFAGSTQTVTPMVKLPARGNSSGGHLNKKN